MSPYGLQDKVQALNLAPKSSTIWTLLTFPGLAPAVVSSAFALAILNYRPVLLQAKSVHVLKGLPMLLLLFATPAPSHTHAHFSASQTPIHLSRASQRSFSSSVGRADHFFLHAPVICCIDTALLTVLLISLCVSFFYARW